jgi:hypothetical protein
MKYCQKIKSLLLLVLFLIPLLGVSLYLTHLNIRLQYPDRATIPEDTEILILGDSHGVFALDPVLIGKAFNFSNSGESYIHNYYKLKFALKRKHSLKAVILPLDLHSFSDFRKNRIHFNLNWLRYLNYPELGWIKKQAWSYLIKYLNLRFFSFKGRYRQFGDALLNPGLTRKTNQEEEPGFVAREGYFFHNREEKARKRANRQLKDFNSFSPEMVFFFKSILKECQDRQLRVILLKLPITEDYYQQAGKLIDIHRLDARVQPLVRNFTHVCIFDFQKIYFKNEAGLFWDPQHLNKIGARDISVRIHDRLIRQGIID